ncbi:unnamed protein product [Ectocarpus sp. 8 AP-2014]
MGHQCVQLSGGGVFFVVGAWIHVPINFSGVHFPPVGKHAEGPGVGREGGTQTGQTLRNENGGHACACGCCERTECLTACTCTYAKQDRPVPLVSCLPRLLENVLAGENSRVVQG